MEFERSLRTIKSVKRSFLRSSTKVNLLNTRNLRRPSTIRLSSDDKINRIIFDCDSQILVAKQLKEEINKKDKEIIQDFEKFNTKVKSSARFYDENYVANAIRVFRDQKKAFIYTKGRFIGGSLGRKVF